MKRQGVAESKKKLIKPGGGYCLRFALTCVFKIKCTLLAKEPTLCFEPLLSIWTIALFSDSTVNIHLCNGYIFGEASTEQNKLNLTVIRKHSKCMVMEYECFTGHNLGKKLMHNVQESQSWQPHLTVNLMNTNWIGRLDLARGLSWLCCVCHREEDRKRAFYPIFTLSLQNSE